MREYSFAQGVGVVSVERDPAAGAFSIISGRAPETDSSSSSSSALLGRPGRVVVGGRTRSGSGWFPVSTGGIHGVSPGGAAEDAEDAKYAYSVDMGTCSLSGAEIDAILQQLAQQFNGDSYHIIERNCNHFSDAFCRRLVGRGVPSYITRAAWCARWFTCFFPRFGASAPRNNSSNSSSNSCGRNLWGVGNIVSGGSGSCGVGRQQQRSISRRGSSQQPLRLFGGTGQRLGSSSEGTVATTADDASEPDTHASAAAAGTVPSWRGRTNAAAAANPVEKLGDALRALTDRWKGNNRTKDAALQQQALPLYFVAYDKGALSQEGSEWTELESSRALLAEAAKARMERQNARFQLQQQLHQLKEHADGEGQRQQYRQQQQQQQQDRLQQEQNEQRRAEGEQSGDHSHRQPLLKRQQDQKEERSCQQETKEQQQQQQENSELEREEGQPQQREGGEQQQQQEGGGYQQQRGQPQRLERQ